MIMKKLVALILVLGLATVANAMLTLDVSTTEDLEESDTLSISISGDGATSPGMFYMGISVGGLGSLDIDSYVMHYAGNDAFVAWTDDSDIAELLSVANPFLSVSLNDIPSSGDPLALGPTPDPLLSGIIFHCDGAPDTLTISLFDGEGGLLDSVTITQIPEPITLALLGLGGLFIRRKK